MREFELILPLRVVPQPMPQINKGGDCGACVLAGLSGLTVEQIYTEIYEQKLEDANAPSWIGAHDALGKLYWNGYLDRLVTRVPHWSQPDSQRTFGDQAILQSIEWFDYVTMGLDAGYYGLMNYSMDGGGSASMPDHYVMVCGARRRSVPHKKVEGASKILAELFISCSSTKTEPEFWIESLELLSERGGFNIMMARPAVRE
jgi:hypothetical protein